MFVSPLQKLAVHLKRMGFKIQIHEKEIQLDDKTPERTKTYYYLTGEPIEDGMKTMFSEMYWFAYNKKRNYYVYSVDPSDHPIFHQSNDSYDSIDILTQTDITFECPEEFPLVRIKRTLMSGGQFNQMIVHDGHSPRQIFYLTNVQMYISWNNNLKRFVMSKSIPVNPTDKNFEDTFTLLNNLILIKSQNILTEFVIDLVKKYIHVSDRFGTPAKLKYKLTRWLSCSLRSGCRMILIERILLLIEQHRISELATQVPNFEQLKRNLAQICAEHDLIVVDCIVADSDEDTLEDTLEDSAEDSAEDTLEDSPTDAAEDSGEDTLEDTLEDNPTADILDDSPEDPIEKALNGILKPEV